MSTTPEDMDPEFLTVLEAAELLRVNHKTLYDEIKREPEEKTGVASVATPEPC